MKAWLRRLLARRQPAESTAPEADAATDPAVSKTRPAGESSPAVGRTAGEDDAGYAAEQGAERRQQD
ncbi:hypothetical protein ACFS2C_10985 [Prauserella oleivorans]|uniref:Signal recognition particle-docking protein FtsY n=1 Tax=Prauserella oleivorans TaxID=1478153 RepID=A0ABW5W7H3_9PSEU